MSANAISAQANARSALRRPSSTGAGRSQNRHREKVRVITTRSAPAIEG
jgi:hypothetical protein